MTFFNSYYRFFEFSPVGQEIEQTHDKQTYHIYSEEEIERFMKDMTALDNRKYCDMTLEELNRTSKEIDNLFRRTSEILLTFKHRKPEYIARYGEETARKLQYMACFLHHGVAVQRPCISAYIRERDPPSLLEFSEYLLNINK